jgi:WS/DGAT/MGAT family acyltransferase
MDRMTPLDAAFLQAEDEEPGVSLAICSVAVFEGPPPSTEEFAELLRGRLPLIPRYRQKARKVPFDLGPPVWVDDEHFDLGYHLRRTALPAPGRDAELAALVGRVMAARLDRSRPLWEYWLVEQLHRARWALISKVHHCMVDGVSGTDLYGVVLDPTPTPRPPAPDDWLPEPEPTSLGLATRALAGWRSIRSRRSGPRPAPSASPACSWVGRGTPRAGWPRSPVHSCRPAAPRSPGR